MNPLDEGSACLRQQTTLARDGHLLPLPQTVTLDHLATGIDPVKLLVM
jgi:hypothetical protein